MSKYISVNLHPRDGLKLLEKINSGDLPYCLLQNDQPGCLLGTASFKVVVDGNETVHELALFENGTWVMKSHLEV